MSTALHILVDDDDRRMARTLVDTLRAMGYEAQGAHGAAEALQMISTTAFDCVLSDIKMPDVDGVELVAAIRQQRPQLPVVLMTAYSTDQLVREGLEHGAMAVLAKPLEIHQVPSFLSALATEPAVTIIDDDPQFCQTLGDILRARGLAVNQLSGPSDFPEDLRISGHVILLDMKLQGTDGLEVLKRIRQQHPHLPVILLTGYREEMLPSIEKALQISAYTCLYKPFPIEDLLLVLSEVTHQELGRMLGRLPKEKGL